MATSDDKRFFVTSTQDIDSDIKRGSLVLIDQGLPPMEGDAVLVDGSLAPWSGQANCQGVVSIVYKDRRQEVHHG